MTVDVPETRYAVAEDGTHLAYQVSGDGPFDLAWHHGWLGSLELLWEHSTMSGLYEELGSVGRLIRHDMRATGLSDRAAELPTLETQASDLVTVLDAVGSYRTVVAGAGPASGVAALFAATHPARTRALVLWTPWSRGSGAGGATIEEVARDVQLARESWGTERYAARVFAENAPSMVIDRTFISWYAKVLRHWVTPGTAAELVQRMYATDVETVMRSIRVPTLVLAREWDDPQDDEAVAALIPNACLVRLPGSDYASFVGDRRSLARAIADFVHGLEDSSQRGAPERALATVLFLDIVESTQRVAHLGDRGWAALVERHNQQVRRRLAAFGGREVDTAGDGFFATFAGPAQALRCALTIVADARDLGLEVRAGVHTGEVEVIDGKAGGLAVVIGSRVAHLASPSEIAVTQTVRDLSAGAGLVFEHVGTRRLKGVPGSWRVYRVVG